MLRLNLGCGRDIRPGFVNVDRMSGPGIDAVADLNRCSHIPLPFETDSVDEFLLSHIIEHIPDTLGLMEELHRIAKPGAILTAMTPYGSSDDAWEDPTHVRAYFIQSWGYFSQPYYARADYGYRGDWQPTHLRLIVEPSKILEGMDGKTVLKRIYAERNVVLEMTATLTAIKPARTPERRLMVPPAIDIIRGKK